MHVHTSPISSSEDTALTTLSALRLRMCTSLTTANDSERQMSMKVRVRGHARHRCPTHYAAYLRNESKPRTQAARTAKEADVRHGGQTAWAGRAMDLQDN